MSSALKTELHVLSQSWMTDLHDEEEQGPESRMSSNTSEKSHRHVIDRTLSTQW